MRPSVPFFYWRGEGLGGPGEKLAKLLQKSLPHWFRWSHRSQCSTPHDFQRIFLYLENEILCIDHLAEKNVVGFDPYRLFNISKLLYQG